jgi:hypothetical protein
MASKDLHEFFEGRTIGYQGWGGGDWTWRGEGYDEGWNPVYLAELLELHRLLTDYLGEQDRR